MRPWGRFLLRKRVPSRRAHGGVTEGYGESPIRRASEIAADALAAIVKFKSTLTPTGHQMYDVGLEGLQRQLLRHPPVHFNCRSFVIPVVGGVPSKFGRPTIPWAEYACHGPPIYPGILADSWMLKVAAKPYDEEDDDE